MASFVLEMERRPIASPVEHKRVRVVLVRAEDVGEHRGKPLKAYEVYEATDRGRVLVGRVREVTETLERRSRGKRYVNARWTGARTRWRAESVTLGRWERYARETRQDAVAQLFGMDTAQRVAA